MQIYFQHGGLQLKMVTIESDNIWIIQIYFQHGGNTISMRNVNKLENQ